MYYLSIKIKRIMVKCLICGFEKPMSIVEHLKFEHKMTTKEYKTQFPGSRVKSLEFSKLFSKNMKEKWEDPEYRDKVTEIRKITHNTPEYRKKASDIMKQIHKERPDVFSGFTGWSKSEKFKEWVVSDERINKISKTSKERWENPEYREKTINTLKNVLNDGRCKKNEEFKENMSVIISELYSNGLIKNEKNKYKTGIYISKTNEEFIYSSSYELGAMEIFDNTEHISNWTNKHGIRIKYYYNDLNRHYIPDFKIDFKNGDTYIIEMKGWDTEEVQIKKEYALKIYPNYRIFYSVDELKQFIDEKK